MRDEFISNAGTIKEREFWKQFFAEADKRSTFVRATFNVEEFGIYIHNPIHFNSSEGKYSLMFTRRGLFRMNNVGFEGKKWDGLNRLKNWCITTNLPEQFYSDLKSKKLLVDDVFINIPVLLRTFSPVQLNKELFQCIDLFV